MFLKQWLALAASGKRGGTSCPQGAAEYHQGRKGCRAGEPDPTWGLELMQMPRDTRVDKYSSKATDKAAKVSLGWKGNKQILLFFRK